MKKIILLTMFLVLFFAGQALAASPKSKFYDFGDQLIDGTINKPTTLYTDARTKVKFDRLLKLKKSFLRALYTTAKEKVFK
tara:strand:+ start:913 stop:1155 length:243 start_codon:yes stop_codon:yes gene_type:complete